MLAIVACHLCLTKSGVAVPMVVNLPDGAGHPVGNCTVHGNNVPAAVLIPDKVALPQPLIISPHGETLL